jgi:hypothetical protein
LSELAIESFRGHSRLPQGYLTRSLASVTSLMTA